MHSDEELIKRCIARDRKAQKLLYERYAPVLLGVCIRYASDRDEAEDILQDGFLKVFDHLEDFGGYGSLVNWMRKIMVNTAITNYHRTLKHRYHSDYSEVQDQIGFPESLEDVDFTREELLGVIQGLPPGYKMVFNLYAIEGYKHREIAEMMEIDVNTSKSQYSRARQIIRKKLEHLAKKAVKKENKK